jgi:hypothetical protein
VTQIRAVKQDLASLPAVALANIRISNVISEVRNAVDRVNDSASKLGLSSASASKSAVKQVTIQKLTTVTKRAVPKRKVVEKLPLKVPFKLPKLTWEKKLPRGYNFVVNALVRSKGVNKEIKLNTTPNRALRRVIPLIDNSLSRSFQLKIVGVRKVRDVKAPSLRKFRAKISRGTPVLNVVEKTRFSLDTLGEKRRIQIEKLLRQKRLKFRRR